MDGDNCDGGGGVMVVVVVVVVAIMVKMETLNLIQSSLPFQAQ